MWFSKKNDKDRNDDRRGGATRANTRREQRSGEPAISLPKIIWIPLAVLGAVAVGALLTWKIGALLFWENPAYAIQKLEIHVDGPTLTASYVRKNMAVCEGTNMFASSLQTLRKDFLQKTHIAKSITLHRRLPGTLDITVVERTPIARLGRWGTLAVDREGYVFNLRASGRDYPVVSGCGSETLKSGARVELPVMNALEIVDCCNRTKVGERVKIASLDVSQKQYIEVYLQAGERIKIGWPDMEQSDPEVRQKVERKLAALAAALRASEERGKRLVNLDLTFTDQYIPGQEY